MNKIYEKYEDIPETQKYGEKTVLIRCGEGKGVGCGEACAMGTNVPDSQIAMEAWLPEQEESAMMHYECAMGAGLTQA